MFSSQFFHNIIDNAVKNTSNGEITITSAFTGSHVEIHIADTGTGMSDEQMMYYSRLFKKKKENEHMIFKKLWFRSSYGCSAAL